MSDTPAGPLMTDTDKLMNSIEVAIRYASELGENAYDHVYGRGLHAMRVDIRARLASALEAKQADTERLTQRRQRIAQRVAQNICDLPRNPEEYMPEEHVFATPNEIAMIVENAIEFEDDAAMSSPSDSISVPGND